MSAADKALPPIVPPIAGMALDGGQMVNVQAYRDEADAKMLAMSKEIVDNHAQHDRESKYNEQLEAGRILCEVEIKRLHAHIADLTAKADASAIVIRDLRARRAQSAAAATATAAAAAPSTMYSALGAIMGETTVDSLDGDQSYEGELVDVPANENATG
jgi:hypothetical protein